MEAKIEITKDARGRYYHWSTKAMRRFPISRNEAEVLLATKQAYLAEARGIAGLYHHYPSQPA